MTCVNRSVRSNLLQQNCFVRDVCVGSKSSVDKQVDSFVSIDEVVTDSGVLIKKNVYDYPITPQYVQSFADSADYRNSLVDSVNASSRGVNLCDVRGVQSVSQLPRSEAFALYNQLKERFSSVENKQDVVSEVKSDE